jgi:beta-lactamase class D
VSRALLAVLLTALLSACAPAANGPAVSGIDQDKLNAGIDAGLGGLGTCVILTDAKSGAVLYHYGHFDVCSRPLPPCATFNLTNALIGLDRGVITPQAVVKWDGSPQPVKAWESDADLAKAIQTGMAWWFQRLARSVGREGYVQALSALNYGSHDPTGPIDGFWLGPQAGGGLTISTRQQADFLRRFYADKLPVQAQAASTVKTLMVDETRTDPKTGQAVISGEAASCASQADGARNVAWYVGRLLTPTRDVVFAASVEGADAPPGLEVERRLKGVFSDAGLWPAS